MSDLAMSGGKNNNDEKYLKCPKCEKRLVYFTCSKCQYTDWDGMRQQEDIKQTKKQRMKRVEKEFRERFDKEMLSYALKILGERTRLTIKELIDLFEQEGMFRDMEATTYVGVQKIYMDWAIRVTITLAKKWHKREEVFIGTRQCQGHPYEIYLPEEKANLIEREKQRKADSVDVDKVIMLFGKHKGMLIKEIAERHSSYVEWLFREADLRDGHLKNAVEHYYIEIMKNKS